MTDRALDHFAIRQLIAGYCHAVDGGRFDAFQRLWTDDAVLEVMGQRIEGAGAIRDWIEASQPPQARGTHATFEPLVELEGDDRARVTTAFVFFATREGRPAPTASGRYLDEVARQPDGAWRFARREIVLSSEPSAAT